MSIETISLVVSLIVGFLIAQAVYIAYLGNKVKQIKADRPDMVSTGDGVRVKSDKYGNLSYTTPEHNAINERLSKLETDFQIKKQCKLSQDMDVQERLHKLEAAVKYPETCTMKTFRALSFVEFGGSPIPLSKVVKMLVDKAGLVIQQNPAETVFVKKKK